MGVRLSRRVVRVRPADGCSAAACSSGVDTGYVYSLDAATGCVHWSFLAETGVRNAISVGSCGGQRRRQRALRGVLRRHPRQRLRRERRHRRAAVEGERRPASPRRRHGLADAATRGGCTFPCPRAKKPPAAASTIPAAPSAAASSRSTPRPGGRSGRRTRSRSTEAGAEELARDPALDGRRRGHLARADHRSAQPRNLRRNRRRVYRAGARQHRCRHGHSHGHGQSALVGAGLPRTTPGSSAARRKRTRTARRISAPTTTSAPRRSCIPSPDGRRVLMAGQKSGQVFAHDPRRGREAAVEDRARGEDRRVRNPFRRRGRRGTAYFGLDNGSLAARRSRHGPATVVPAAAAARPSPRHYRGADRDSRRRAGRRPGRHRPRARVRGRPRPVELQHAAGFHDDEQGARPRGIDGRARTDSCWRHAVRRRPDTSAWETARRATCCSHSPRRERTPNSTTPKLLGVGS